MREGGAGVGWERQLSLGRLRARMGGVGRGERDGDACGMGKGWLRVGRIV